MRLADHAATARAQRVWTVIAFAVPAVVMGALAVARAIRLQPSRDELATQAFASLPFDELWRAVSHVDAVLSPFYAIAHLAYSVMPSDLGLRLPSVLGAVGAVIATTYLARRWWGTAAGLVAGMAVAVNPLAVEMAATARPYALATLFAVLAVVAADRALESPRPNVAAWAGYAACVAAAGFMHLFSLLAIVPVVILAAVRGWRGARTLILATCGAAAVLLPFALTAGSQQEQVGWIPEPDAAEAIGILANLVTSPTRLGVDALEITAIAIAVSLVAAAAAVLVGAARRSNWQRPAGVVELARYGYALAATLLPWGVLLVTSMAVPLLRTAYIAPSVVGLALVIAASLHAVLSRARPEASRRRRVAALATSVAVAGYVVLVGASTVADARTWRQDAFAALATSVESSVAPGDLIVVVQRYHETGLAAGLARFTDDTGFAAEVSARLSDGSQPLIEARRVVSAAPLRTDLLAHASDDTTVWLVSTGVPLGAHEREELARLGLQCAANATPMHAERFGGLRLTPTSCSGS